MKLSKYGAKSATANSCFDLIVSNWHVHELHWHKLCPFFDSCCCWGTCLYLFLLTFMVAILGVFCGYLMYNIWQINSDTNAAHRELKGKLDAIQTRKYPKESNMATHKYALSLSLSL